MDEKLKFIARILEGEKMAPLDDSNKKGTLMVPFFKLDGAFCADSMILNS